MGYYMAGGYYRAGGFGSFLGGLLRNPTVQDIGAQVVQAGFGQSSAGLADFARSRGIQTMSALSDVSPMAATTVAGSGPASPTVVHHIGGRRSRRMNPFNPRAIARADRRLRSFMKHVRKYVTITHHGAHGVKMKHHRKRR